MLQTYVKGRSSTLNTVSKSTLRHRTLAYWKMNLKKQAVTSYSFRSHSRGMGIKLCMPIWPSQVMLVRLSSAYMWRKGPPPLGQNVSWDWMCWTFIISLGSEWEMTCGRGKQPMLETVVFVWKIMFHKQTLCNFCAHKGFFQGTK